MNSDQETGDIMSGIDRETLSLVLQSLTEMNFRKTHRVLESESGVFIDIKYVEELVATKKWDEVTRYVSGFTKWDDNHHSTTINFIFWSWKYFEALDKCNLHKATDILTNKLQVFSESNEELMKEMTLILKCHLRLANREIQRKNLKGTLFKKCLKELPIIHFPTLAYSKLKHLFLQGNPNNSEAGLASQSANLAPEGQIEPRLTIVKPVPDPLSRQLKNLRTINQDPPCLSRIRRETVTKSKDVRKNVNPRLDEVRPSKRMRLNALTQPNQIWSITVSEPPETNMIIRLIYTNSGMGLLVLASNGIKILWKLQKDDTNPDNKAKTTMYTLQLWEPGAGKQMKNDFPGINCFALTNNDSFLMLASGGSMTLFDTTGSETTKVFMCPACKATCLLFHPQDNNVIFIGMDNSTIQIFNVHLSKHKVIAGHCRRITGLGFSTKQNVLVSSAANSEIIVWEYRDCKFKEMKKHSFLWFQDESILRSILWDTQVQFHQDQKHFLVVTELKFAIYTTELECKNQRCLPLDLSKMIVHATFSCDSQLVYIAIKNGTVAMFSFSNLQLLCEILRDAYLPSNISSHAYPIVIAAHPQKRNQIALGFSDGRVIVIELPESTAQQHVAPSPVESESTRSKTHTAQQMTMLPAPGEAGSSRPSFDANVEITSGGLALQSSHLVPAGCQIEPQQTIARPVPDPLSLQQRNLPTINQKGGSPFMRINKRGRFEVLRRPNQVRSLTVSEPLKTNTIMRLIYTNSGNGPSSIRLKAH
ncbi:protein TPR3-like isoform X1 [Camellia sinensis]|uniref:protein TPR3-like isoform X1 n=1 Tax=Camellia sinensis TaxID=4442 RepID=UPI001036C142|nr:protein TPR3-like isoform X1 [Camellia sinensis]